METNASTSSRQVYIVHGFGATPESHWFSWLAEQLRADGHAADVLRLPNSDDPSSDAWLQTLSEEIKGIDDGTYFVAHSLGVITLLRYLSEHGPAEGSIGGLMLVSGFEDSLPALPQLDAFAAPGFDSERIIRMAPHRSVVSARNDEIVPFELTERLSRTLEADFHVLYRGGHFLASDGFEQFPLVYRETAAMLTE